MKHAWLAGLLAIAVVGCGEDECAQLDPAAEIAISIAPGLGARVEHLEIAILLNGQTYDRTFETVGVLADGATAFAVDLGAMRVSAETAIEVRVVAFDGADAVASGQQTQTLTVDACNRISVSLAATGECGDGTRDPAEACDGADLGDASCLQFGRRAGAGGLACGSGCVLDPSACSGGPIDSVPQLTGAIEDARARAAPTTIAIEAGTYDLASPLVLSGSAITLEPLDGVVVLRGGVALRVEAADSVVRSLVFEDTTTAAVISGRGVTFEHNDVRNPNTAASAQIQASGDAVAIRSNLFRTTPTSGSAIVLDGGTDARVEMNVIDGPYTTATDFADPSGSVRFDHNSLRLPSGTAARLRTAANVNLCVRNNAVHVSAGAVGYDVAMQTRLKTCDGVSSGTNAIGGGGTLCTGRCNDCDNQGALCAIEVDPAFVDGLCLPGGSALIDAGRDVGVDLVDANAATYQGDAPDVGAREAMTSRSFGGAASSCP